MGLMKREGDIFTLQRQHLNNRKQSLLFNWNKLTSFGSGALLKLPAWVVQPSFTAHCAGPSPSPLSMSPIVPVSPLLRLSLSSVTTSAFVSSVSKSFKAPPLLLERGGDALLIGFLPCLISDPSDGAA